MKIKTSELIGAALDWAVAKVELEDVGIPISDVVWSHDRESTYSPSINWQQGGPLIEKYQVWLSPPTDCEPRGWDADVYNADGSEGSGVRAITACDTALISACRAIVASRIGLEVDIPEGLLS